MEAFRSVVPFLSEEGPSWWFWVGTPPFETTVFRAPPVKALCKFWSTVVVGLYKTSADSIVGNFWVPLLSFCVS